MLKWIFERVEGAGKAVETPIGNLPTPDALDLCGLDAPSADIEQILSVDTEGWKKEAEAIGCYYDTFGDRLPKALREELAALQARLEAAR